MTNHQEHYKGREQSYIKHCFLTQYLEMAAFKTFQGSSPTFNFADAFAGPWNVADDSDYSDASFDQALNTLEGVRISLARKGLSGLKVRFCFCEKNLQSAEKLRRYAEKKRAFEINVFPALSKTTCIMSPPRVKMASRLRSSIRPDGKLILDQYSNFSVSVMGRCCSISWPRISTAMPVTKVCRDQSDVFWRRPTGKTSSMHCRTTGTMRSVFCIC